MFLTIETTPWCISPCFEIDSKPLLTSSIQFKPSNFTMLYYILVGFQNCPDPVQSIQCKIVNVFHLGNLLSEFHHAVQFWLKFRIVQIPVQSSLVPRYKQRFSVLKKIHCFNNNPDLLTYISCFQGSFGSKKQKLNCKLDFQII